MPPRSYPRATPTLEADLRAAGHLHLAGCDEAGRGALAGPVYAAAVILDPQRPVAGLRDSKVLPAAQRERLAGLVRERALAWAVAAADAGEVEQLNVLHAALLAMRRALDQLRLRPSLALVDGPHLPPLPRRLKGQAVVDGDASVDCIMAAGILAKVQRDAHMAGLEAQWPGYGFARHFGYGTPEHLAALDRLGPCSEHRRTFRPVAALCDELPFASEPVEVVLD
jgi:ribonuclease HII